MKSISSLLKLIDDVRSSYWFVPVMIVFVVVSVWFATIWVDRTPGVLPESLQSLVMHTTATDASNMLTAIMGATISVISLTFSLVIVVLTLASGQFGSRLLYTFMRDFTTKFVLGVYGGTFVFSLITLRVLSSEVDGFVPQLTIQTAIVLMLISVLILVYFLHHISVSLQATSVVNAVGVELAQVIERFFPEEVTPQEKPPAFDAGSTVKANKSGVLQAIDHNALVSLAERDDLQMRVCFRPGHFVVEGAELIEVKESIDAESCELVQSAFAYGDRRTLVQDVEFAFQQLAEIAVRALSPGINDPNTAIVCVDQIGLGLARIMRRSLPECSLQDSEGNSRVWLNRPDFSGLLGAALNQVRQYAARDVSVSVHLLKTLDLLASLTEEDDQRAALLAQAEALYVATIDGEELVEMDRATVEQCIKAVRQRCG